MDSRMLHVVVAGAVALLGAVSAAWLGEGAPAPVSATEPAAEYGDALALTGEVTPRTRELAAAVVDAARRHGVPLATEEVEITFVDRIDPDAYIAGRTDGRQIVVGCNVAEPERTLLHELAHAVVGIEHGHDGPWRSVYVTAVSEAFGDRSAQRELRRIRWVYDKSYLDRHIPDRAG